MTELYREGCTGSAIAQRLNAEGWRPAKRCSTFNGAMVNEIMMRLGLRTRQHTPATSVNREKDEWTFAELAHLLDMPLPTLYAWMRRGELKARLVMSQSHRLWLIHANQEELARLRLRRHGAQSTLVALMPAGKFPATTKRS